MEMCIPKPSDMPTLFIHSERKQPTNQPKNLKGLKKPKGKNGQQKVLSHNLYSYVRLSPADGQAFFLALILNQLSNPLKCYRRETPLSTVQYWCCKADWRNVHSAHRVDTIILPWQCLGYKLSLSLLPLALKVGIKKISSKLMQPSNLELLLKKKKLIFNILPESGQYLTSQPVGNLQVFHLSYFRTTNFIS